MIEHSLKTAAPYWDAIERGEKTFEVRRDDRGFQKGDVLLLRRLSPGSGNVFSRDGGETSHEHAAKTLRATVLYVLTGGQLGIEPGHVVMALKYVERVQ